MRLVHVTDCYLPRLGGIELLVSDLAERQRAAGHDVHVLTSEPGPGPDPGWVHRAPVSGRAALTRSVVGATAAGALLDRLRPDVVHAHVSVLSPFATALAGLAARRGTPTVVTAHSLWTSLPPVLPWLAGAGLGLAGWPVVWSAVSRPAAESLRALVGPRVPVAVLPNAVDGADWARPPTPEPSPVLVPTVVSVGRLAPRKRPLPLARMLRRVRSLVPAEQELRAVIVGDGPQRPALTAYLRRHRMTGWVSTPGRLSRPEIAEVLAAASVYVAPAPLESFGIAALEARCAGLPVVADRRSGVSDFVTDGVDGVLTADDLATERALARLLTDPGELGRLQDRARTAVPDLGWDRALDRADAAYALAAEVAGPRRLLAGRRL